MPGLAQATDGSAVDRRGLSSIPDIRRRLGKRSDFEVAAAELTVILLRLAQQRLRDSQPCAADPAQDAVWDTVARAAMLLRTRHEPLPEST